MKEIWKQINGYEGMYEVSNFGKVRTIQRTILRKTKLGNLRPFIIKSKIKTANFSKNGYMTIALVKENKTYTTYLHRIIADAFVTGKTSDNNVVNHINGNKTDNRVENLEWVSSSENNLHALDNFLKSTRKGVTSEFINEVVKHKSIGLSNSNIAKLMNSTKSIIQGITSGRTYKRLQ